MGTKQLYHPVSNQCLDCDAERGEVFMNPCDATKASQKWQWKNLNEKIIEERNKKEMQLWGINQKVNFHESNSLGLYLCQFYC